MLNMILYLISMCEQKHCEKFKYCEIDHPRALSKFALHEYNKVLTNVLTYTRHCEHLKRLLKVYGYVIGESKTVTCDLLPLPLETHK